jgi:hypothetical protein
MLQITQTLRTIMRIYLSVLAASKNVVAKLGAPEPAAASAAPADCITEAN